MDETINYKDYTISIRPDDWRESPREWDNCGIMVCFHRDYNLGDRHDFADPDALHKYLNSKAFKGVYLPLYLYDHSGISMSCNYSYPYTDRWDSGQVGYIYMTSARIRKEWGAGADASDRARACLADEVKTYDQYLTGDIWVIDITGPNGQEVESCGGFYGYDYALTEARAMVDYDINLKPSQRPKITAAPASAMHH